MTEVVRFERRGGMAVVTIDNPPVSALSQAVRRGILDNVQRGIEEGADAIVLIAAGRTFIAGADIREFGDMEKTTNPTLPEVIETIENSPAPVVAALHGNALGGGLETALGCHYRVGVEKLRVGLPEVNLGILPGASGTQRLPRLIGPEEALPMILSGKPVNAQKALALGIIDEIIEGDLLEGALAFAQKVVDEKMPLRRICEMDDKVAAFRGNAAFFEAAREGLKVKARGYLAPFKIVDCIEAAVNLPFDEGLAIERELFLECRNSTQSQAQIHAFFSEREVAKIPDVPKDTPVQDIAEAAVVGAGTMGCGIAMCVANAGIPVSLLEIEQEALDRGMATIERNYAASVKKGRLTQDVMDSRLALIKPVLEYSDLAGADIVIEAVFEEMDIKKDVLGKLDAACKPDAILATNTSTLDIDELANITTRPGKVIGTHFFSPAHIMVLLEVVRGDQASKETVATAMNLGKTLGKVSVLAGNCDGFIGNRMLERYLNQALFLVEEGALPQQVDKALLEFGMAMGPFAMSDMAGLDVSYRIRQRRRAEGRRQGERDTFLVDRLCERGRHGQKTGGGYYRYEEGSRAPLPDPEVESLIIEHSKEQSIERREFGDDEIVKRCIYAMVNEGAKILEEGIALRSCDIDIAYLYGYGFPRYRGGPMKYADLVGLQSVLDDVRAFSEAHPGEGWEPAALLERLAAQGGTFNG